MKKLIILLFLFLPHMLPAQFITGFSAGLNLGTFGGVAPANTSYAARSGLNFNAVIGYRINKDFTLTLQPAYSQRGSTINVGEDSFFDTLKVYSAKINFLTLPIFVRINSDNRITYFISGLEFAVPLSATLSGDNNSADVLSSMNKIDILATIGMGLRFSIGKPNLMIELRYYQGLLNFNSENQDSGKYYLEDIKNLGFMVMAGLEWEL